VAMGNAQRPCDWATGPRITFALQKPLSPFCLPEAALPVKARLARRPLRLKGQRLGALAGAMAGTAPVMPSLAINWL